SIDAADIRFPGPASELIAYVAHPRAAGTYPAILVIHENRGLVDHTKDVVRRYAKEGFAALAVDLVSRGGGTQADANANAAVLAIYGGADTRVTGQAPQVEANLKAAGKTYEIKIYEGAQHAFFNDTGASYNQAAAVDAWGKTLAWFRKYLA